MHVPAKYCENRSLRFTKDDPQLLWDTDWRHFFMFAV